MRNLILDVKIWKELVKFRKFKANYNFEFKPIDETYDGRLICDGVCIRENADAEFIGESETFVNVGYKLDGEQSKVLSNLFPYKFYFKGHKLSSAEAVFQSFKFKDKASQKLVFEYSGINSNRIKTCSNYDWRVSKKLYFWGYEMARESTEYELFIDELYVSLLFNPLFKNALLNVKDKYILHSIGEMEKGKTTFSRYEFEKELNTLKAYVLAQNKESNN